MAPSAIPMEGTTTELTNSGITANISKTAPSFTNGLVASSPLPELDASTCRVQYTSSPKDVPLPGDPCIAEQKTCTDHMITCSWTLREGWHAPELKPYGPLSLMPTSSCLHYATQCFEGMKLYRGYDGKLRLFRPDLNCNRMLVSSTRIALPGFNPEEVKKLIVKLCATDGPKWLPKERPGSFLYIRPSIIANDSALGVQKPKEALLFIILTVFPSMDTSATGLKLLASQDDMVRAWPGGFGYAKVGANYGPSLVAQGEARAMGYDQILWLFGENCEVTEAGASNFFIVWRTRSGMVQLVTAPLSDRIILDGVTRRSILELARQRLCSGWEHLDQLTVVERKFSMYEVLEAAQEGRILEAFAAGTAFFIAPISLIRFKGEDLHIPMKDTGFTGTLKGWLKGIMYGKERHEWGHVVEETEAFQTFDTDSDDSLLTN